MIKTVISMMLVCAIMVQSGTKETITGVTMVTCGKTTDCKQGTGLFGGLCLTAKLEPFEVACTDGKIKLCNDEGNNCVEYENGVCKPLGVGSTSYTWAGGCGKSGSIELATTALFSMVVILFL